MIQERKFSKYFKMNPSGNDPLQVQTIRVRRGHVRSSLNLWNILWQVIGIFQTKSRENLKSLYTMLPEIAAFYRRSKQNIYIVCFQGRSNNLYQLIKHRVVLHSLEKFLVFHSFCYALLIKKDFKLNSSTSWEITRFSVFSFKEVDLG